jgi:hypothetical protein
MVKKVQDSATHQRCYEKSKIEHAVNNYNTLLLEQSEGKLN